MNKHRTITLIGSAQFKFLAFKMAVKFSLEGHIVHVPSIFYIQNTEILTKEEHKILDDIHRIKMMQSDEVYVVNPCGYIGDDTREEINFCKENDITLVYMNPDQNDDSKEDK